MQERDKVMKSDNFSGRRIRFDAGNGRTCVEIDVSRAKQFAHEITTEFVMQETGCSCANNLYRLDKSFIGSFRGNLHSSRKRSSDPDLEQFLLDCFEDELIVEAYFNDLEVERMDVPLKSTERLVKFKPLQEALLASKLAGSAVTLSRYEKRMAAAAALVFGTGTFYLSHPFVRYERKIVEICPAEARAMNYLLLEDALRKLRSRNTTLGEFVTGIVDPLRGPEDIDAKASLRRVREVVDIVTHRIEKIWVRRVFS